MRRSELIEAADEHLRSATYATRGPSGEIGDQVPRRARTSRTLRATNREAHDLSWRLNGVRLQPPRARGDDARECECPGHKGGRGAGPRRDRRRCNRRNRSGRSGVPELDPRRRHVGEPFAAIPFQAPAKQPPDRFRRLDRQRVPVEVLTQHRGEHVRHVVAGKRAAAGQHLVQNHAERPDISAAIDGLSPCLFRRHVCGRAEHHSELRRPGGERRRIHHLRCPARRIMRQRFSEAEVQHLHGAVLANLDVRRLEIAMDDALLVRGFEGLRHLPGDRQRLDHRQSPRARSAERGLRPRPAP